MEKPRLGVLLIGVRDLAKARPFYEQVFGLEVDEVRPHFMSAHLGEIEFNIEENSPDRRGDWVRHNLGTRKAFCFKVEDIHSFVEGAKAAGASVVEEPLLRPWHWYEAVIADPDGNEFVLESEAR
jgi:predicted enzyme related to lactoylglutathione lyase